MGSFSFKQFSVIHEKSAMKVNTDGVLLGAWCSLLKTSSGSLCLKALDVGTGTGVIALMVAQRISVEGLKYEIVGIDSDAPSSQEAADNFLASEWSESLQSLHLSFKDFASYDKGKFDLIISNPPYFVNSLKAPCRRRSYARHTDTLSFEELAELSANLLTNRGALAVILPAEAEGNFISIAASYGLFLSRICRVSTILGEDAKRVLMEFSLESNLSIKEERLSVQESPNGLYTMEYRKLTSEFYLGF